MKAIEIIYLVHLYSVFPEFLLISKYCPFYTEKEYFLSLSWSNLSKRVLTSLRSFTSWAWLRFVWEWLCSRLAWGNWSRSTGRSLGFSLSTSFRWRFTSSASLWSLTALKVNPKRRRRRRNMWRWSSRALTKTIFRRMERERRRTVLRASVWLRMTRRVIKQ